MVYIYAPEREHQLPDASTSLWDCHTTALRAALATAAMWTVAFALLPALLLPSSPPLHSSVSLRAAPVVAMAATPDDGRGGWLARLRSASAALATAAVLAVPRGPARAAEIATPDESPAATQRHAAKQLAAEPAFLALRRKKKTLPPPLVHLKQRRSTLDLDKVMSKKEARRFTERSFIFSDSLTAKPELAAELDALDEEAESTKLSRVVSSVVTTGGALGLVYVSVKGLTSIERWMKQQELDDIEAEKELTGQ